MPEYIEREALIKEFSGGESVKSIAESIADERFVEALKKAPAADVVEVVRCNKCIFGEVDTEGNGYVKCLSRDTPWHRYKEEFSMPPYHFCSYGKRKEGANDAVGVET